MPAPDRRRELNGPEQQLLNRRAFTSRAARSAAALLVGGAADMLLGGCGGTHSSNNSGGGPAVEYLAEWTGNDTAADAVGGHNGTVSASGVSYISGIGGDGFFFNGNSAVVTVPDSPALALTSTLAIAAIIDVALIPPSGNAMIFLRGDVSGVSYPYALYVNSAGSLAFTVSNKSSNATVSSPIVTNNVYYIGASLDSFGNLTLSVNDIVVDQVNTNVKPYGALVATMNPGIAIGNSTNPAVILQPFRGLIQNVQLYSGPLNAQDV